MGVLVESVRAIVSRRELLFLMISREVRQRYLRTWLGLLWVLLQPAILLVFYTFVFAVVLRVRLDAGIGAGSRTGYMWFVLGGLLPWAAFSDGANRAAQSLLGHASVITKVAFPVELLPLSAVGAAFVSLAVSTSFVIVLLGALGQLAVSVVLLPIVALLLATTALGIGYLLAVLNAFVRDISHLLGFLFNLWLYATPVLYPSDLVPEGFRWLLSLNPIVPVIESYRTALISGEWPPASMLLHAAAVAVFVLVLGLFLFSRAKRLYAEVL